VVLVDTCGWIEWLTNGALADKYEPYFNNIESMLVPTSVQFELYKWVARNYTVQLALEAIALTEQALVMPLTTKIALLAADLAIEHKLSFADSIIYATAQSHAADLATSDEHFSHLQAIVYFKKTA
jgi:predicted nucleic acid-binding protein